MHAPPVRCIDPKLSINLAQQTRRPSASAAESSIRGNQHLAASIGTPKTDVPPEKMPTSEKYHRNRLNHRFTGRLRPTCKTACADIRS